MEFRYSLGSRVSLKESGEEGEVIGRAEFASSETQYFVRYKAADGRAVEQWWGASAVE